MNYYLKNIYVSNYKNLIDCHIDIQNFAILVGSNNSGKSNFIEIFEILNSLFRGGINGRKAAAYKLPISNKPTTIIFNYEIIKKNGKKIRVEYKITIKSQKIENENDIKIEHESFYYKSASSTGKHKRLFLRNKKEIILREKNGKFKYLYKSIVNTTFICVLYFMTDIITKLDTISKIF